MVRAVLLGTGSPPPNPKRRGPATLLSLDDERFLVDAGSGVGVQLVQAGVRPYDWPRIFITHHHSDHTIDLGHLVITRWIVGQNAPLEVWGPAGTRAQIDRLLDYLARDIEVRRAHMRDREPPAVRVTEIEEGTVMEAGGVRGSAFLVEHDPVKPAYGFRFDGGGRSVVVSGDTRPCGKLARWAHDLDCLIHECCVTSQTSLTGWGSEVVAASRGEEALAILERDDAPSLAVLDWTMPGMDGLELCRRIRALSKPLKPYLIFVTARAGTQDIVTGLTAGADDYIVKPFQRGELRARVRVGERLLELQTILADRVKELEDALARVKLLHGLLPICSYCKKVRDDRNYWQQVEGYIEEHSEAQFTHGICPDCRAKYVDPELERLRQQRRQGE